LSKKIPLPTKELVYVGIILAVTVFCLLSLVYFGKSPWHLIYQLVPGAKSIRSVSRSTLFLVLPIVACLGYYFDKLIAARKSRALVLVPLALFALVEQLNTTKGISISTEEQYLNDLAANFPTKNCETFFISANGKKHKD